MGQVVQSTVLVEQQGAASAGGQGVKGEAVGPSSAPQCSPSALISLRAREEQAADSSFVSTFPVRPQQLGMVNPSRPDLSTHILLLHPSYSCKRNCL